MDWVNTYKRVADNAWRAGEKPLIGITANFGEYGTQLAMAYYESVRQAGGVPLVIPASPNVDDLEDILLKVDALVFTGGGDINPLLLGEEPEKNMGEVSPNRDLQELVLMRRALDKQMPVLGICRGIQVMAAALGGKLIQDIYSSTKLNHPVLKHSQQMERNAYCHTVTFEEGSVLMDIFHKKVIEVNSFHHQAVAEPGRGMMVSARSSDGIVEAIESVEGKSILGVQWHPESFWQDSARPMGPIFDWVVNEAEQYRQARLMHEAVLTLDTHCDTPMFFDQDIDFSVRDDRILVDSCKMRDGGLDAVIMVAYLKQQERDSASLQAATAKAHSLLDGIEQRIASAPRVGLAQTPAELYELKSKGFLAIMRGIENGYAIGKELANVNVFRKRGVVYMTLCHNGDNDICDSAVRSNQEHGGLSQFGQRVVEEMNRVGMMVDLSHAARESFYNALEVSHQPIVCSHSSCRSLCDHPRNLDDEQMRALSHNGGVMQVTLYPGFLKRDGEATIMDAMAHLDHAVEVMGVEHVGLGTDFDGDGGVPGLACASELINFTRQLMRRRYNEQQIAMLWGGNFLRLMAEIQSEAEA